MAKGGFRGGYGGMGGMSQANMMKQAQKMQEELRRMQEELEASSFEATAGGGVYAARSARFRTGNRAGAGNGL